MYRQKQRRFIKKIINAISVTAKNENDTPHAKKHSAQSTGFATESAENES